MLKKIAVIFLVMFPILAQEEKREPAEDTTQEGQDATSENLQKCIKEGIWYLLRTQHMEGYWSHIPMVNAPAVTSISGMALLSFPEIEPEKSMHAVRQAYKYLLELSQKKHALYGRPESVWNLPFVLCFFKRCLNHPAFQNDKEKTKEAMRSIVKTISRCQEKDGGWSYRHGSFSFTTATVLLALREVQDANLEVPDKTIRNGIKFLKKLRKGPGQFQYQEDYKDNWASIKGSVGRGCVCELALFKYGEIEREDLQKTVKNFFRYRSLLKKRLKKGRQGTHGLYGIAPYYFLFGHYFASLATGTMGLKFKKRYFSVLRKAILWKKLRHGKGWLDSEWGRKNYGTAMALLTLANTTKDVENR
jgi:hypothetical protein